MDPLENVTVPVTPGGTVSVIVSGVFVGRLEDDTTGGGITGVALLTDLRERYRSGRTVVRVAAIAHRDRMRSDTQGTGREGCLAIGQGARAQDCRPIEEGDRTRRTRGRNGRESYGLIDDRGIQEDVTETVGAVFTTVTETAGEVAGLLLLSPGVLAVI